MKYFLCFCFTILIISLFAQDSAATFHIQKDSGVFTKVDTMPRFNGSLEAILYKTIKYPQKEREAMIQGTVYVGFIIEKDGTMDSIKIVKGITTGLDSVSLKAMKALPKKWRPGIQNGKPERVQYTFPIKFDLGL